VDALTEGVDEVSLTIYFWNGQSWWVLPTIRDDYFNLASAPSQGAGVYALLGGVTIPQVTAITPAAATNNLTTTLLISGSNFVEPVTVKLVGLAMVYTLPLLATSPSLLTAQVARGLPAHEYEVQVINGDGGVSPTSGVFALYDPAPPQTCFYDFFESGASRWQREGQWAIALLPGGERAITDSPAGNYDNALPSALTMTTAITSVAFSLASCPEPVLTFRHAYVLAKINASQDVGRVEISTNNGTTWQQLASYSGGGVYGAAGQEVNAPEWTNVSWQNASINLSPYTGTVRLRFRLEVDQNISDKGWVLDNIMVRAASAPPPPDNNLFLPFILK
jgi:hypothetical protein